MILTGEATFDMTGHTNTHICRVWGPKKPHEICEHMQDFSKLHVWCCVMRGAGNTIIIIWMYVRYLSFLKLMPLNNKKRRNLFPQDGVLARFYREIQNVLNIRFPNRLIGRGWSHEVQTFHHWIFFCGDL